MDYSLADIRAVTEGEDRDTWGSNGFLWVILIFLFFLAFSGGFGNGFGNGNNNTYNGLSQIERDVLTTSCATQKEVLQNRYDNALQTQTLSAQMAQCLKNVVSRIKLFLYRLFAKQQAVGTYA